MRSDRVGDVGRGQMRIIGFEPIDGLRDSVERGLAESFRFDQISEVAALNPLGSSPARR
jgi:hypothetical protein